MTSQPLLDDLGLITFGFGTWILALALFAWGLRNEPKLTRLWKRQPGARDQMVRDMKRAAWAALVSGGLAVVFGLLAWTYSASAQTRSRSFYDSRGHFSGSAQQHGNSDSYYNDRGQFSGSAIRNSDGSTSYYDGRGHFQGSSPRR